MALLLGVYASGGAWCDESFRVLIIDGASVRWMSERADQRLVLRYAFADHEVVTLDAVNCGRLQSARNLIVQSAIDAATFRQAAAKAFARWQRVAHIAFIEVANPDDAEILIGAQGEPQGFAFTNLTLARATTGTVRPISRALICLNPDKHWKFGFDGNLAVYDLVHTLTHEIGHAIGLDHPTARGHLMSFRYDEARDGLSDGDILGAIDIYGAADAPALDRSTVGTSTGEVPTISSSLQPPRRIIR